MKRKYRVDLTQYKTFEIIVDDAIHTEKSKRDFEEVFWDLPERDNPCESFAIDLAQLAMIYGGKYNFIEGYGNCSDSTNPIYIEDEMDGGFESVITEIEDEEV